MSAITGKGVESALDELLRKAGLSRQVIMAKDPGLLCQILEVFCAGFTYGIRWELDQRLIDKYHSKLRSRELEVEVKSLLETSILIRQRIGYDPWKAVQT